VTFDKFAAQPLTVPKTDYTPEDLAAASKARAQIEQKQQQDDSEDRRMHPQIFRTQFDTMPGDPNTAAGTLRLLTIHASNGDEKGVREILTAPGAEAGLDAIAHYYAVSGYNWTRASSRFSAGEIMAMNVTGVPLQDISAIFSRIDWTKNDDGSWTAGPETTLRKNAEGHFTLDVSELLKTKDAVARIQKLSAVQDRISKAMDQADVTPEQIRAAAQQ